MIQADIGALEGHGVHPLDGDLGACLRRRWRQQARTEGHQVGQCLGQNGRYYVAAQSGLQLHQPSFLVDFQVYRVSGQSQLQASGQPGGQVASVGGGGKKDSVGEAIGDDAGQDPAHGSAADWSGARVVQHYHAVGAVGGQLFYLSVLPGVLAGADEHRRHLTPGHAGEFPGFAQHLQGDLGQAIPGSFGHHPDTPVPAAWVAGRSRLLIRISGDSLGQFSQPSGGPRPQLVGRLRRRPSLATPRPCGWARPAGFH